MAAVFFLAGVVTGLAIAGYCHWRYEQGRS